MSDVLRSPLNKTQFDYIKRCKRLAEKGSLYEKLEYLEEESIEVDKPLQQLIETYHNFMGLRPKEFFELNDSIALKIVNEMLEQMEMFGMGKEDAVEIMEADDTFRQETKSFLIKKVNEGIDVYLKKQTIDAIGKHAFCNKDYEIEYEEYERRIAVLKENHRDYYIVSDK